MTTHQLSWPFGRATVSTTAAMLLDATFLVDGEEFRPFATAPWLGDSSLGELDGHLRVLGAEFVAVPFGSAPVPPSARGNWAKFAHLESPKPAHGYGADGEWTVVDSSESHIDMRIEYPSDHPVRSIRRTITAQEFGPGLNFVLEITARTPLRTSVGVHPILRLPERAGALRLSIPFDRGFTYPGDVPPGAGVAEPGREFTSLEQVPGLEHSAVDISSLPLWRPVEDIVQLCGTHGVASATFVDEGFALDLFWDAAVLPSVMVWISDRALQEEPWRGEYRGLGIEPVASAFDLPVEVSRVANPLTDAGFASSVEITPAAPLTIAYSARARQEHRSALPFPHNRHSNV